MLKKPKKLKSISIDRRCNKETIRDEELIIEMKNTLEKN